MAISLLNTKFFIPTARSKLVSRPLLIEKLNKGIHRKLTIISAPAGFGKTTLLTEWLNYFEETKKSKIRIDWFSIDEGDNELVRFLSCFISDLNQNSNGGFEIEGDVLELLNSPQLPQTEQLLISLINSFLEFPEKTILVIDDYNLIDNTSVHDALSFFIEHIPSQLHLVIATREDPQLPLSNLRAKDQMTELRAVDLRFSLTEATNFLNQVMGLTLSSYARWKTGNSLLGICRSKCSCWDNFCLSHYKR